MAVARQFSHDPPFAQHQNAVTDGRDFLEITRDHDDAEPAPGCRHQACVNGLSGADIDTACRLEGHKYPQVRTGESPADQYLLFTFWY